MNLRPSLTLENCDEMMRLCKEIAFVVQETHVIYMETSQHVRYMGDIVIVTVHLYRSIRNTLYDHLISHERVDIDQLRTYRRHGTTSNSNVSRTLLFESTSSGSYRIMSSINNNCITNNINVTRDTVSLHVQTSDYATVLSGIHLTVECTHRSHSALTIPLVLRTDAIHSVDAHRYIHDTMWNKNATSSTSVHVTSQITNNVRTRDDSNNEQRRVVSPRPPCELSY